MALVLGLAAAVSQWRRAENSLHLFEIAMIRSEYRLRSARTTRLDLPPARADRVADYQRWLDTQWRPIAKAADEMRAMIRPVDAGDPPTKTPALWPELDGVELEELQRRLDVLRTADAVAAGRSEPADYSAADIVLMSRSVPARGLAEFALERIEPMRGKRTVNAPWAPIAEQLAELALTKVADGDTSTSRGHALVASAWASHAIGLDDRARQRLAEFDDEPNTAEEWRDLARQLRERLARGRAPAIAALEAAIAHQRQRDRGALARLVSAPRDELMDRSFLSALRRIEEFERDVVEPVRRDLAWSRELDAMGVDHPRARYRWRDARAALVKSPRYDGLDLPPQSGLVPLGPHPTNGLWAFYHLRSAWQPDAETSITDLAIPAYADDGSLVLPPDHGMVLVLLPGGTAQIGSGRVSQSPSPDTNAERAEGNVHSIRLDPFFLAVHEVTQGQWARLTSGDRPSRRTAPSEVSGPNFPVDRVSWYRTRAVLSRHGLMIPTESQWEYACRANSTTPWSTGAKAESLHGAANVLDSAAVRTMPKWRERGHVAPFDDGYVHSAPVGSFRPNGFGLYDMHGNQMEWCRDRFQPYTTARAGDGLAIAFGLDRTTDDRRPARADHHEAPDPQRHRRQRLRDGNHRGRRGRHQTRHSRSAR